MTTSLVNVSAQTADLNYSADYRVGSASGSIQDLAGSNYAGITDYNFTATATPQFTPNNE